MEDYKKILFSKAFAKVPGRDYNRVSYELRGKGDERYKLFYEVVLTENTRWEDLRDKVYPSLIRFLKNKSIDPENATGVVISVFYMDYFHLIEVQEFIRAFCEIEGLNNSAFHFRILRWLSG
jgi:hypothetical protein